jgi:hypothetical protein
LRPWVPGRSHRCANCQVNIASKYHTKPKELKHCDCFLGQQWCEKKKKKKVMDSLYKVYKVFLVRATNKLFGGAWLFGLKINFLVWPAAVAMSLLIT